MILPSSPQTLGTIVGQGENPVYGRKSMYRSLIVTVPSVRFASA